MIKYHQINNNKLISLCLDLWVIWRPPSLRALTPYWTSLGLTRLGSETSIKWIYHANFFALVHSNSAFFVIRIWWWFHKRVWPLIIKRVETQCFYLSLHFETLIEKGKNLPCVYTFFIVIISTFITKLSWFSDQMIVYQKIIFSLNNIYFIRLYT